MEKKQTGYIYKITSPTGRIYIGQAINIVKRKGEYKNLQCKNQRFIYNSLKCYGLENHKFEIIEEPELDFLSIAERYWIVLLKTNKRKYTLERGLNLTDGGDGGRGIKWSQKSKDKASKTHMGVKKSATHCENISKGLKGMVVSEETRAKLRLRHSHAKPWLGKKLSEEHKQKLRDAWKLRPPAPKRGAMSLEQKQKISKVRLEKRIGVRGDNPTAKVVLDTTTGVYFECIKDAADAYGINYGTLKDRLKGRTKTGTKNLLVV